MLFSSNQIDPTTLTGLMRRIAAWLSPQMTQPESGICPIRIAPEVDGRLNSRKPHAAVRLNHPNIPPR